MSKMRAMVIPRAGEGFRMEERENPEPGNLSRCAFAFTRAAHATAMCSRSAP